LKLELLPARVPLNYVVLIPRAPRHLVHPWYKANQMKIWIVALFLFIASPAVFAMEEGSCNAPFKQGLPIRHPWLSEQPNGLLLRVMIHLSDQTSFGSVETSADSQRLGIHLSERNNNVLISFLASSLGIAENQIEIQTGPKDVKKSVLLKLDGAQARTVSQTLNAKF
jgi:uncharacterized protein YggU (UPF0235/DUF167 family)